MHRVFISYHHDNDQKYKEELLKFNEKETLFIDGSVDTGDISDELTDEAIRVKIRDEYLRTTSITILLVGIETKKRKHIDWELASSMIDGKINKKSGIIVITLPSTNCTYFTATHDSEKEKIYPDVTNWTTINSRSEYEKRYPYLPDRIIDNLLKSEAKISVTNWDRIEGNKEKLLFLLDSAYNDRTSCVYDTHRPMKKRDS